MRMPPQYCLPAQTSALGHRKTSASVSSLLAVHLLATAVIGRARALALEVLGAQSTPAHRFALFAHKKVSCDWNFSFRVLRLYQTCTRSSWLPYGAVPGHSGLSESASKKLLASYPACSNVAGCRGLALDT